MKRDFLKTPRKRSRQWKAPGKCGSVAFPDLPPSPRASVLSWGTSMFTSLFSGSSATPCFATTSFCPHRALTLWILPVSPMTTSPGWIFQARKASDSPGRALVARVQSPAKSSGQRDTCRLCSPSVHPPLPPTLPWFSIEGVTPSLYSALKSG